MSYFRGAQSMPPMAKIFLNYMKIFQKTWQKHRLAHSGGLAPPSTGNTGSAPVFYMEVGEDKKSMKLYEII